MHTVAGYMVWVATTFKYIFDIRPSAAPGPHESGAVARAAAASQFAYPLTAHSAHHHPASRRQHASHAAQHRRQFAWPSPRAVHRDELAPDVHFCTADLGWVTGGEGGGSGEGWKRL